MNLEDVTVKIAKNRDKELLTDFEEQTHITEPDIWITEFNRLKYKEKLASVDLDHLPNNKILLAILDGKVIGRCDVVIMQSLFSFDYTGYIDWIYTLKHYRGNSVGKKMLSFAEQFFKQQGVSSYYLFTASNEQSHAFYHRQESFQFTKKEVAEKEIK